MELKLRRVPVLGTFFFLLVCGNLTPAETHAPQREAVGLDMKQVERGRYLTKITGCNDCIHQDICWQRERFRKTCGSLGKRWDGVDPGEQPTEVI